MKPSKKRSNSLKIHRSPSSKSRSATAKKECRESRLSYGKNR